MENNMEIDESENKRCKLTIVESLQGVVQNEYVRGLEEILDMITNDLMFDDPGLFDIKLLVNRSTQALLVQEAYNIWLINQILHLSTQPKYEKLNTNVLYLQKEMISASLLKHPSFFEKLIKLLIEFTKILHQTNTINSNNPLIVNIFKVDNRNLNEFAENCNFVDIKIETDIVQQNFQTNNIKLLAHSYLLLNPVVHCQLMQNCTDCFLNVLSHSDMKLKTNCLLMLCKIWKELLINNPKTIQLIIENIFKVFQNIIQLIETLKKVNLNGNDHLALIGAATKFCEVFKFNLNKLNQNVSIDIWIRSVDILLLIDKIDDRDFYQLKIVFYKLLEKILNLWMMDIDKHILQIEPIFKKNENYDSESIPILACYFLYEITTNTNQMDNQQEQNDIFSKMLPNILGKIKTLESEAEIKDALNYLEKFLENTKIMEYNLKKWHQMIHVKRQCTFCGQLSNGLHLNTNSPTVSTNVNNQITKHISPLMNINLIEIVQEFIDLIKNNQHITMEHLGQISKISIQFLSLEESAIISKNSTIKTVLNLATIPFTYRTEIYTKQFLNYFPKFTHLPTADLTSVAEELRSELCRINIRYLSRENQTVLMKIFENYILDALPIDDIESLYRFYLNSILADPIEMCEKIINSMLNMDQNQLKAMTIAKIIKPIICITSNEACAIQIKKNKTLDYQIICRKCQKNDDFSNEIAEHNYAILKLEKQSNKLIETNLHKIMNMANSTNPEIRQLFVVNLSVLANHFPSQIVRQNNFTIWKSLFLDSNLDVLNDLATHIGNILEKIKTELKDDKMVHGIQYDCIKMVSNPAKKSINDKNEKQQEILMKITEQIGFSCEIDSLPFISCIRTACFYMMSVNSFVNYAAAVFVEDICAKMKIKPKDLLNWHSEKMFKLMIDLSMFAFLKHGCRLDKILFTVSIAFQYSNVQEFIVCHYSTLITMILPWRIKHPQCQTILDEFCEIGGFDLAVVLTKSFLSIYIYLSFNENDDIRNKCIEFICETTRKTLQRHLRHDVKKTLSEVLVCQSRDPSFVRRTIQMVISNGPEDDEMPISKIVQYIQPRFLGILTHFSAVLIFNEVDKDLQKQVLLSFGEIIRLMGPEYITRLRYKILALLKSAINLAIKQPDLQDTCAKVWKIFIYTVDVQSLGSLLSQIVVSFEALLTSHPNEVNEILNYLIVTNGNILSLHISDLFFIEETRVSDEVKKYVKRHLEIESGFMDKLRLYYKHAMNDNLDIRKYSLRYLSELLNTNRLKLNELIIGRSEIYPLIDDLLSILMAGCKDNDENLQKISGKCLGQIGAIEPSHLSRNYSLQNKLALSIHTDEFAIMALAELCRTFQYQKDIKYVDGCLLAIQEIFILAGVNLERKKKMNVWQSIPEKLRPSMEPFLTSSYTSFEMRTNQKIPHPVFDSKNFTKCEQWGFYWASSMIEMIENDETAKNFLKSCKSSMKNDVNILSAFLPYILIHALQSCNQNNYEKIYEELNCVFTSALSKLNVTKHKLEISQTDVSVKCAKFAFNQFDFMARWIRQFGSKTTANKGAVQKVEFFLWKFNKKMIAKINFAFGEYARALMYLELFIKECPAERLQQELSFMSQIYGGLMDTDSLEGALSLKQDNISLSEQVMLNAAVGRLQDSTVLFEKMMQDGNMSENNVINMFQCYIGLDQPKTALLISEKLMKQTYDRNIDSLLQGCAEPLWRMGQFEELDKFIETNELKNSEFWGVRYGQSLLAFRQHDQTNFRLEIDNCRLSVLKQLQVTEDEQSCYIKGYPFVIQLHLISEIENVYDAVNYLSTVSSDTLCSEYLEKLFSDWDARLEIMKPTAKIIEPILCYRRILLNETTNSIQKLSKNTQINELCENLINRYIGQSLLKSVELARDAENFQQAQLFILNAEKYKLDELFLEKAKICWKKRDQANSLKILERGVIGISANFPPKSLPKYEQKIIGEARFLIATYNAESMNINPELNKAYFQEALDSLQTSEKCYVHFAQYLEKIYATMPDREQTLKTGYELQFEIMTYYGKSMLFGCRYIYQSMPRVLSVWLDCTAQPRTNENQSIAKKMNILAEQFSNSLPSFMFFTTFSQLVSRICHPSMETYVVLKSIIIKLILDFPQRSLWMILSVFKSSYASRVRRCTEIFSDKRLANKDVQTLIRHFCELSELLIVLTNTEIAVSPSNYSISTIMPRLRDLFNNKAFSKILMPFERLMHPVLPAGNLKDSAASKFNAFPLSMVYIHSIKDELIVLSSLQKPKRVILVGSDGKEYGILMKPKDDLRKDFRLMEFNNVVKQYLHQDPEARHRRLRIRTYTVLPLNEECGILEWVPNLQAYRGILTGYYKQRGLGVTRKDMAMGQSIQRSSLETKRNWFQNKMLPKHPPVLNEWFFDRFTTPHNWYQARSSYIRTTAVMSIVGYILGLGDRHGENILLDTGTGDIVHVDFNCLFNKGEKFEVPELVPFRLTHNMVHAMGPCGVEGLYRKCCEITMKVMEEQIHPLMSVLRPFVYDPLVTWNRTIKDSKTEKTDDEAMRNIKRIEERLKGFVTVNGTITSMPLSTDGVVNHCIIEAKSIDNLAAMYIGWGPFL